MGKIFYTKKDGKIDRIQTGDAPVGDADWNEAPDNWNGEVGDDLTWFDSEMNRIPDLELVQRGIRTDKTGCWYNKDKIGKTKQIYNLDEDPGEDYTNKAPLENEPYQLFDREADDWVIDTKKKVRAEKDAEIGAIKAQIEKAERKIIRPLRAIQMNRATNDDLDKFNECDTLIETTLRPELNRLEMEKAELLSA